MYKLTFGGPLGHFTMENLAVARGIYNIINSTITRYSNVQSYFTTMCYTLNLFLQNYNYSNQAILTVQ